MIRIRLRRTGSKKQPSYRIVVADARQKRDGRLIEVVGHYNPRTRPSTDFVKEDRALHWLSVGAQPSDSVLRILKRTGTWDRFERLRKGEEMPALVAEAEANRPPMPSPRTRYPSPAPGQSKQKAAEAEALTEETSE